MTLDKKESEFKISLTDFFSTEILAFSSFPQYKIHGIKPFSLSLFICQVEVLFLFVAFKLLFLLFGCAI